MIGALGGVIGGSLPRCSATRGSTCAQVSAVDALEGDAAGHVRRAKLSDGTTLDVDVVVASLGVDPQHEWLEGAGLATGFWGVACDAGCRAFDVNGVVTDNIFVAGDIARAPHVLYGYQFLALEHWDNAVSGAKVAAHNMVRIETGWCPHLPLPSFWSAQFGVNIKGVGVCPSARGRLHPGLGEGAPFRCRLWPQRPHRRSRHLQPRQVVGELRGIDRAIGAVPAAATGLRPPAKTPSRCRPGSAIRACRREFPMWC